MNLESNRPNHGSATPRPCDLGKSPPSELLFLLL